MRGFNKTRTVYHEGHEERIRRASIRQKLFTTKDTKRGYVGGLTKKAKTDYHEGHEGHEERI